MNQEIKKIMKEHKVKQWQIAERLGVSEFTFCRWMRHELPEDKKRLVLEAVNALGGA